MYMVRLSSGVPWIMGGHLLQQPCKQCGVVTGRVWRAFISCCFVAADVSTWSKHPSRIFFRVLDLHGAFVQCCHLRLGLAAAAAAVQVGEWGEGVPVFCRSEPRADCVGPDVSK
jgi:hypothetical protein